MVKKKVYPLKETKKRGGQGHGVNEDVKVNTGLPPKVDGQLRCFCKVSINQVLWSRASPPNTIARVKWWGEEGQGAVFRPVDIKRSTKANAQTTARYPVRSGPRQFASYLNDMGALTVAVFTSERDLEPIGHTEVTQIGLLSNNKPINGFFPIVSKDEKIGELQVSIMLEPLMASYDGVSTIPTTDVTMDSHHNQESMVPSAVRPQPHSQQPIKPQEDLFISPASHTLEDGKLQNGTRAHNAADLRQKLNYDHQSAGRNQGYPVAITANGDVVGMSDIHGNGVPMVGARKEHLHLMSPSKTAEMQPGKNRDLLSMLLSRGTELRQAMVVSSLNAQDEELNNSNIGPPAHPGTGAAAFGAAATYSPAPGVMVDNLVGEHDHSPINMLLGSPVAKHEWQMLRMVNGGSPGPSICSEGMEGIDMISEPGDPLHDRTLLQELFYKRSDSELSELSGISGDEGASKQGSLQDPGNVRPPSRCSSVSSLTAMLPDPDNSDTSTKKRKRKQKTKSSLPGSQNKNMRTSRSRSKERNPRMTNTVPAKKSRSRSRSCSRSKSRSLSRKRKGSLSDSDVASTPRSETSRVSFDPAPSDIEDDLDQDPGEKQVDGLSVERLTLLGRVHVARVNVLSLSLPGSELDRSSSSKASSRLPRHTGKPPRPAKNRKPCTYLIEYQFPVVATSRDKHSPNAMATEVMRVASKAVSNGVISFNHRSVFPLMFDGAALEKWWKSALIFKVYAREQGQKAPVLLGSCGIPLKCILKSDDLHFTKDMEIRELGRNSSFNNSARNSSMNSARSGVGASLLGTLKVSVELASDHKDFATSLARTRVAEMSGNGQNIVPVVPPSPAPSISLPAPGSPHPRLPSGPSAKHTSPAKLPPQFSGYSPNRQSEPIKSHPLSALSVNVQEHTQSQKSVFQTNPAPQASSQQEALALHTLILIPEGCSISLHGVPPLHMVNRNPALLQQQLAHQAQGRDQATRNTYLVCRMFWSNDSVHSNVCWGTLNPQYNFSQVAPVLVTPSLLERMRNNYMVIEVWDKKTSAENDKLIGITKLSLHQFYMSFRDAKISGALLRSEYPVVAIDNYMPVLDPFSGLHFGQLSVLLAMGSAEQVACLQRLKTDRERNSGPQRPHHFLERQDIYHPDQSSITFDSSGTSVEHAFEVVIQGVRGMKLLENMTWGEADCFVQYFFPAQAKAQQQGPTVVNAMAALRSFRTATTLCIPDPTFHDVTRHRLTLPLGTPVQRELLTACANSSGGSGGLPFEVWCRFYHPNVRDQVIARATLPLAKLCAMVTMQKRGEPSVQSFSLPLTPLSSDTQDAESQAKMKGSGLMDVTVHYKTQKLETAAAPAVSRVTDGSQVCLRVSVIRASGLKAAAEMAAHLDSGMQYPAEVGVNSCVKLKISFLGNQDERITKTVARTFSPEFSHHVEIPLQLLWSDSQNDPGTLAQLLETGHISMEVWHQIPGGLPGVIEYECDDISGGKQLVKGSGDVLLGTCTVPLAQLLIRHAGIKGWFALDRPSTTWIQGDNSSGTDCQSSRMVGGLEVGLHFAHSSDRQRVVESARSVGWSPVDPAVEQDDWQEEEGGQQQCQQVLVKVDQVSVPLSRVLLPGQDSLDPSARCYVRYKFYDKGAVVSRTSRLQGEGKKLQALLQHRHTMVVAHSAPFLWYLREEQLEVQVWVTYGSKDRGERPQQRDKLVGTAFVDLLPLCDSYRRQHRISGLLPLFKPGTASLSGAFIQLHLTSNLCRGNQLLDDEDDVMENDGLSDADFDSSDSFHQITHSPVKKGQDREDISMGPVFTVHLAVERALHLPTVRVPGRSGEIAPTTYISYQSADKTSPTYSDIVANSTDPVWDYTAEVPLSNDLLTQDSKNLVLKVWHKPDGASKKPDKSCDRVLGFVSVDLCPLNSGLQQICGWYNIVDFNGQSRGQIKVSITPVDLSAPGTHIAASGGPSISLLSSRGVSVCVPSEPVAGFTFLPLSLPAVSSLPTLAGLNSNRSATGQGAPLSLPTGPSHWQPHLPVPDAAGAGDSSKSMLFSSLRQQLRDLDGMTQRLRLRLSCEDSDLDANQPASARSADILNGTHSGLSTIHTSSSLTVTREVLSDVSRQLLSTREITSDISQQQNASTSEDASHNAADSGAFSGNNTGKSQEAPDSQRSDKDIFFGQPTSTAFGVNYDFTQFGTATTGVDVQFMTELSQGHGIPHSPRDFSSNSQTSQGFQPLAATASDSSTSGSARVKPQKKMSLIKLTAEEEDDPQTAVEPEGSEKTESGHQDYLHNAADYNSDNCEDDEMFGSYHKYRAMLDREEEENQHEGEDDDSNVETITPRRINDVSGMLRQFAEHPGTFPSIFPPGQDPPAPGDVLLQTWPAVASHQPLRNEVDSQLQQASREKEEKEEVAEMESYPSEVIKSDHDRNSFIDSWLEDSAEQGQDIVVTQIQPELETSELQPMVVTTTVQQLELDLPNSEAEFSETETPRENGFVEIESVSSEGKPAGKMRLLSNVELIDTLTSVNSGGRLHGGQRQQETTTANRQTDMNSELHAQQIMASGESVDSAVLNGCDGQALPHRRHLLSNVDLYSTASSFHPVSRPPRHLLSNVELASSVSGSSHHPETASSRPSRQSSANSAGRIHELEVCAEIENSEDEAEFNRAQPPIMSSDEVSQFFVPSQQAQVMNGVYDSSEEELDYEYCAGARPATVKPKATRGREPCQSTTGTTEDSGMESGAKSSQDEREALSLLDSTHSHGHSSAAAVPEFFLPTEQLQASMRALQLATSAAAQAEDQSQMTKSDGKAQASSHLLQRLKKAGTASNKFNGKASTKGRPLPTAEEAKRIAKIFSTKPS